jgi:hypothetical protein
LLYVHKTVEEPIVREGKPHAAPFIEQCNDFPTCVRKDHAKDDAIDAVGSGIEHLTKMPVQWSLRNTDRISPLGGANLVKQVVQHRDLGSNDNRDRFKLSAW